MLEEFDSLVRALADACHAHYGENLVSLGVFGSMGRGTPRPDSDIDVLIVSDGLPPGRVRRVDDFAAVERAMAPHIEAARRAQLEPSLSPVFKMPAELAQGSPLLLDMTEDARILYDRDGFLQRVLDMRTRLAELGAKRIWFGNAWIWDLKPDYRPGEVFEL